MKLKLIALAAMMAATGAANAAIDSGQTGNGELFFTAWDGANSYTFDLNTTIDAFQSSIAAVGTPASYVDATLDALFTTYLSTANLSSLVWNIVASDGAGARRVINTFTTLPATTVTADIARSSTVGIQSFVTAVNTGITNQGGVNSAVFAAGTAGYANNTAPTPLRFGANNGGGINFDNTGTVANNSYASGLGLMRLDGAQGGIAATTYTPYTDGGFAVRAYFDASAGKVTIAAVPEPETYAMLLAGLGLMGAIARRRRNQA